MSGHGQREKIQRANAILWRDRVVADARCEQGLAAVREHQVTPRLIMDAAELISGRIAAGAGLVGYRDLRLECGKRERRRVIDYFAARGHVERIDRDLFRPIGARANELL